MLATFVEKIVVLPSESKISSKQGMGLESRLVTVFCLLRSTQNRTVPSFLVRNTMRAAHSVCASFKNFFTSVLLISAFPKSGYIVSEQYSAECTIDVSDLSIIMRRTATLMRLRWPFFMD